MTLEYFYKIHCTDEWYGPDEIKKGKFRMARYLPDNPNDKLVSRIIHGTTVYGRRSDYKNTQNKYFYLYNCKVCNQEAITTRHYGKWPKDGMTCGLGINGNTKCKTLIDTQITEKRSLAKAHTRNNPTLINGYIGWNVRATDKNGNFIRKYKKDTNERSGYVLLSIFEHRVVVEEYRNKPLTKDENVHHINMIKLDNKIENLWVCTVSQHTKAHFSYNFICGELMNNFNKYSGIGFNRKTGRYYLINQQ